MAGILLFIQNFFGYITDGSGVILVDDDGNQILAR